MKPQDSFSDKSNEELLLEYRDTKDLKIKQELTLRYLPIVKRVAIQMRDVYVSFAQVEDIINEGVLTIMAALDKYDPEKNVKFESYVSKRVWGLVIDIARKHDWVPRGTRKSAKTIDNVINTLHNDLGRTPTDQEVAEALDMTTDQYYEELKKNNLFQVISLDMVLAESSDKTWAGDIPSVDVSMIPEQRYLDEEKKAHLREGIKQLRENEQLVISLYYVKEVNIKTIAQILKVSEPRVSQIHSNALKKLRKYMEQF